MFGLDNDMELPQPPDEPESTATFAASDGSAEVWRVTVDDDPEKQWDSDNSEDAGIDAAFAFEDGARKVTIERISPPNAALCDADQQR